MKKTNKTGKKFSLKRSFKYGAASTAFTVVFIAAVVLVNVLMAILVERFPLKADLTAEGMYDISQETVDYIQGIEEDVAITILCAESQFDTVTVELMKKYSQYSQHISFNTVDLTVNPTYVQKYNVGGSEVSTSTIIVESDKRFKTIELSDMYSYNTSGTAVTGYRAEQKLTSAVMYVTSDTVPLLVFTDGHEEVETQYFENLAQENGYDTDRVNLLTGDLPEETSVIAIMAPTRDFTAEEISKIDAFVKKGNVSVMLFMSPEIPILTRLEDYVAEWGIARQSTLVLDMENAVSYPNIVLGDLQEHDINEGLIGRSAPLLLPASSSLEILFESRNSYSTASIVKSFSTSYAKNYSDEVATDFYKAEGDVDGPFDVVAMASNLTDGTNKVVYSHMMVFGSVYFAADNFVANTSFQNADFLAAALSYFKGSGDLITISPKYYEDQTLGITAAQGRAFSIILAGVLPLVLIVLAVVVFVRRKHL